MGAVELLTCSAQLAECGFKYECHASCVHDIRILSASLCGSKRGRKDIDVFLTEVNRKESPS